MRNFNWTAAEKKAARKAFDSALQAELNSFIGEFKAKAHAVQEVAAIWEIRDWLDEKAHQIDVEYDYRYSQLILVFARLVRQRKLGLSDLNGLSEDKLQAIQHIAEL